MIDKKGKEWYNEKRFLCMKIYFYAKDSIELTYAKKTKYCEQKGFDET